MKPLFLLIVFAVTLSASPQLPPFTEWGTWMGKGRIGKVERLPAAARFVPAEGDAANYVITLMGRVPAKADGRYKLTAAWRASADLVGNARLQLYFQARDRKGKWINAVTKGAAPTRLDLKPGTSGKIECRIDLGAIPEAAEIGWLVPSFVVFYLKGGSIEITDAKLEPWEPGEAPAKPAATVNPPPQTAPKIAGLPGFRVVPLLRPHQWPSPIRHYKFQALVAHTPLAVNEVTLRPAQRAAAFQWPGGYTVLARFQNGRWQLQEGRLPGKLAPVGELDGDTLRFAEFGTGVLASAGKRQLVLGGAETHAGVALLLAEGAPEPPVFSRDVLADLLHWCYLEEAADALARTRRRLERNRKLLSGAAYYAPRRWQQRLAHIEGRLKQRQEAIRSGSRGYVPALAALPAVRDRYNYLIAFASVRFYESRDEYLGPVFHDLWHTHLQGAPEVADALETARQAEDLLDRAFYDQRHAFTLGKTVGDTLAASWCDNLTQVPRRACGPDNLVADGRLSLARGESEGIQLVLTAGRAPVADCAVALQPALPAGLSVKFHLVDYIRSVPPAAPMLPLSSRGAPVADILKTIPADQRFTVAPETNQAVWMTFRADDQTAPGTYRFTAVVTAADGLRLEVPLQVTVHPFRLGANRLASMAGLRTSVIRRWYCDDNAADPRFPQARRNFIAAYLEYKMNPIDLYVPSPALEDLPFALKHGLREVNVSRAFDDFADPAPAVPRHVRLYGSDDGRAFSPLQATARLQKRGEGPLADTDLVIVPEAAAPACRYYKVHYAEKRDWYASEPGAIRLYPAEGGCVELADAAGSPFAPAALQFIQPDRTPEKADGFRQERPPALFVFDQLNTRRTPQTHASIVIAVPDGKKPASIRLVNRQIEKAAEKLRETYGKYHAVAGDKVIYYVYGYDEAGAHLHPKVRTAAERLRQAFPQMRTVTTIARIADAEIYRSLSVHCPGNGSTILPVDAAQHRRTATDFWIYVGGGSYFPFATFERVDQPLIQSRAFFFPIVAFPHITGWLHWATNLWDLGRRHDSDWSRWDPTHGENSGMKAIFYPGPDLQCHPSLRAEAMRDGIEDVNYARLAAELIAARKFPNDQTRDAAARELADIQSGFARSVSMTCRDPEALKALRARLAALLNTLWGLEARK